MVWAMAAGIGAQALGGLFGSSAERRRQRERQRAINQWREDQNAHFERTGAANDYLRDSMFGYARDAQTAYNPVIQALGGQQAAGENRADRFRDIWGKNAATQSAPNVGGPMAAQAQAETQQRIQPMLDQSTYAQTQAGRAQHMNAAMMPYRQNMREVRQNAHDTNLTVQHELTDAQRQYAIARSNFDTAMGQANQANGWDMASAGMNLLGSGLFGFAGNQPRVNANGATFGIG
jgi:hypothetical protein